VTLGDSVHRVACDVAEIAKVGGNVGLVLDSSKCELIAHQGVSVNDKRLQLFLGAPVLPGPAFDQAGSDRCDDLSRAVKRLHEVGCHDALILLRSPFSAVRVLHLRCSPSVSHSALDCFDSLL